jgi:hypothetical protein
MYIANDVRSMSLSDDDDEPSDIFHIEFYCSERSSGMYGLRGLNPTYVVHLGEHNSTKGRGTP